MSSFLVLLSFFFPVEEFLYCEFGDARLVSMATKKLSDTCLFVYSFVGLWIGLWSLLEEDVLLSV